MRWIGFSSGSLDPRNPGRAVLRSRQLGVNAIELSSLRYHELEAVSDVLDAAVDHFEWISIHAPVDTTPQQECSVVRRLVAMSRGRFSVVAHPDVIHDWNAWSELGSLLLLENMDRRKQVGRYAIEFEQFFDRLPAAGLCLDVAHARQVDPTLVEGWEYMRLFGARLREIHISEVSTSSAHSPVSLHAYSYLKDFLRTIPSAVPAIIESVLTSTSAHQELLAVRKLFAEALSEAR